MINAIILLEITASIKYAEIVLYAFLAYFFAGAILSFMVPARKRPRPESTTKLADQWYDTALQCPDEVKLIADPGDALRIRLALVRNAEHEIALTTFAFTNLECGTAFLSEVLQAADRGVKVRIVIDAKMGKLSIRTIRKVVQHPMIEFSRYNPFNILLPWTIQEDMHDKMMIVDGKYALLGGRNIEPSYFGLNEPASANKADWDVFVYKNPGDSQAVSAVDTLSAYFELLWQNRLNKVVRSKTQEADAFDEIHAVGRKFKEEHQDFYNSSIEDFTRDMIRPHRIKLLHNPLRSGRKEPWVIQDLTEIATHAQESLYIQTPYATATKPILKLLKTAASHFKVIYISNSYFSTNNPPAYSNYYYQRRKFVETGINIYEYQGSNPLHGKSMVFDEHITLVGSFNLDSRSVYLDTETMLAIDSEEFTETFLSEASTIINQSLQVGPDNKYLPSDTVKEGEVPFSKRVVYFIFFVGLRLFQFYL
jgi:putative cardiolipin synthase